MHGHKKVWVAAKILGSLYLLLFLLGSPLNCDKKSGITCIEKFLKNDAFLIFVTIL